MSELAQLSAILDRLERVHVLCLGDVMLDRYVYGRAERLSPEAPIPVIHVEREAAMLGGAGNVARNLAALGAKTTLIAVVGADGAGGEVERLIARDDGLQARLVTDPARATTVKTRYVAAGQQLLRADAESTVPLSGGAAEAALAAVREALAAADILVLSDYAKGVLSDGVLRAAIEAAHRAGKPVIADPKRAALDAYGGCHVVTPNLRELCAAAGAPCLEDGEVAAAAERVIARTGIPALLVTRSERGLSLVRAGAPARHLRAHAREVFDVSGAGDTVVATMAAALAAGADPLEAAHLANLAGGIAVGKVGTAVVHRDELAAAVRAEEVSGSEAKIVPAMLAEERVAQWRAGGLRVGFTNGCFDLLHPGHVSLLRQARDSCDRLVVGLNSDASVQRLKGADRPVQSEAARAVVLASLQSVDLVVIFDEDTPLSLLQRLRPDLLVKGADYSLDQVVGAEEMRAWGGRVLLATLEPGHSTTGMISRMGNPRAAESR